MLLATYLRIIKDRYLSLELSNGLPQIISIISQETSMKISYGLILGITMAHYWVDQNLWKFKTQERRKWLISSFPFLSNNNFLKN